MIELLDGLVHTSRLMSVPLPRGTCEPPHTGSNSDCVELRGSAHSFESNAGGGGILCLSVGSALPSIRNDGFPCTAFHFQSRAGVRMQYVAEQRDCNLVITMLALENYVVFSESDVAEWRWPSIG